MISVLAVLLLILYTQAFLYPQITATVDRLLVEDTRNNAVALSNHLNPAQGRLTPESIPLPFIDSARDFMWEFNAQRVRLYSASGRIIYSSEPKEIGLINNKDDFLKRVAKGIPYTQRIEKDQRSAEGARMTADVVAAYIPLTDGVNFAGAVEVYKDVSVQKKDLSTLVQSSSRIVLTASALLIVSLILILWRDQRTRHREKMTDDARLVEDSERKYRDIFENAMDSIFILDDRFRYVDANPMATQIFGYSHEEFLQMSVFDVIPEEQASRSEEEFKNLQKRGSYENFVGRIRTKDGRWLDVEVNSSVIRENGRVIGSRDIVRDITQRKKLESELARARNLDALGILAGGIAHDFNNLMTSVLGNVSLARMLPAGDNRQNGFLKIAEEALMRARDLTQQLLTFSQGGLQERKVTTLPALIKSNTAFHLAGSSISCELDLANDLKPALIDSGQISQVLQNLILNARDAMPDGGHILIRARNYPVSIENPEQLPAGDYLELTFSDSGSGIAQEHLPQVFDPYFSTKERDTRKGMGLGLSICHSIIKNHEGHIEVESQPGKGARFRILLPASEAAPEAPKTSNTETRSGPLRILVMDDEEIILQVAQDLLQFDKHRVTCVKDGEQACTAYQQAQREADPFNLVILDLTIPGGMGGVETLHRLRELDPQITAVVSSGYGKDPASTDYADFGFKGSIAKPYNIQALRQELKRLFPGHPD